MFDFTGQVVIVTGAAGSLGRAVSQAFWDAGAKLVLIDLHQEALDKQFADWDSARCLSCAADLTQAEAVQTAIDTALVHFAHIDVLANVAGAFRMGTPLHETPLEDWDLMLNINAKSVFLMSRALVPHMLARQQGKIVNVAARVALAGKGNMSPYVVSKTAVLRLTESLSAEVKARGINVNSILPGTIDTPANRADMPEADFSQWVAPADLAQAILFLASPAARAIHGVGLPVYGLT